MFWIGLCVGLILGALFGIFILALCTVSRTSEEADNRVYQEIIQGKTSCNNEATREIIHD